MGRWARDGQCRAYGAPRGGAADAARLAEGKRAARDGHKATACPYRPDGPTAVERAQARMWLRGYDRINPLNIDYGD